MSDERRERWADIFINIPVYDDYTLSKATDAAMAGADEEIAEALRISDAATDAMRNEDRSENAALRAELERLREENAQLRADRAAVLREAADVAEDEALRWPEPHQIDREQGALDVMALLRRLADEAQEGES